MPYIGRDLDIGSRKILSLSGSTPATSYTLQYNSADYSPSAAQNLIVSISGVIQAPGTAYTVSGATLDFDGTWVAPGGGITTASQWRLTTDFTGTAQPIDANWEEVDAPVGFGILGSSMTESSGIFTFPSTGYWYIQFLICVYDNTGSNVDNAIEASMYTTTDDGTYAKTATAFTNVGTVNDKNSCRSDWIMDITNTSNDKVKFYANSVDSETTVLGNTGLNETSLTFVRLGDT
jgi:hypothetical protein